MIEYAKGSYFKHFRLFDFVLNNNETSDLKQITIYNEDPVIAAPLTEARELKKEELETDDGMISDDETEITESKRAES